VVHQRDHFPVHGHHLPDLLPPPVRAAARHRGARHPGPFGHVDRSREITLSDGNPASQGDLVRARLNADIDAAGQLLANRDVIRITGWTGQGADREAIAQQQLDHPDAEGRRWSEEFTVPYAYLEEHAELAYAGNVYVAQGRTVDNAHLVVAEGMTRDLLYVGMTRGREENLAHVVTGPADPADLSREERQAYTQAAIIRAARLAEAGDLDGAQEIAYHLEALEPEGMRERPPWELVIAAAMERDDTLGTATEAMRAAADFPVNTRHLYEIAEAGWWLDVVPQIDDMVRQRIRWDDYQRYLNDPERPAFLQELRRHEIGGRPIADVLDAVTARPLDGARSVAAVLHGRAGKNPPRPGATPPPGLSAPRAPPRTTSATPTPSWTAARPSSATSSPPGRPVGAAGLGRAPS
jgi:hypothetical protein